MGGTAGARAAADLPGARRAGGGGGAGGRVARNERGRCPRAREGRGVRAVELTQIRYQVGQRLRHPQFGEGLIVEVHTDRGREVLEVVFDGQLRRLAAAREWVIVDGRDGEAVREAP